MSNDDVTMPDPQVDPDPERAPGGADATLEESDVGASAAGEPLLTPDQPLSAQQDEAKVPDELREPEPTDTPATDEPAEAETESTD
jgi:hypothetical protein